MTFGEVLKSFKSNEQPDLIVPLVEDSSLRNAIVAWRSVVVKYTASDDCTEVIEAAKWEWMWDRTEFDVKAFGIVAGCKPQDARDLFTRLKGLRLIYPDGTINIFATKYLQSIIMAKLPKPPKQPAR